MFNIAAHNKALMLRLKYVHNSKYIQQNTLLYIEEEGFIRMMVFGDRGGKSPHFFPYTSAAAATSTCKQDMMLLEYQWLSFFLRLASSTPIWHGSWLTFFLQERFTKNVEEHFFHLNEFYNCKFKWIFISIYFRFLPTSPQK